jgi:uncharacterized protein YuzE
MKKRINGIIGYLLLAILALSGCKKNYEINPGEIFADNEVLSYYDKASSVPKSFDQLGFVVNKDYKIRSIIIDDDNFITYKDVSVGDSVDKVLKKFKYETQVGSSYCVLTDGKTEKDTKDENRTDDWLWINYNFDEGKIFKISIYDVMYGREMR